MQWQFPHISEKSIPANFSIWVYLLAFVISAVFFGFVILLINGDTAVSRLEFIICYFVIAPLLFGLSITGFVYSYYYCQRIKALFFNQSIKNKRQHWQAWARESVSFISYGYLTDIDGIALKVMGLEGRPPMSPDKVLPITAVQNIDGSPLFFVFDSILLPMKPKLARLPKLTVLLSSPMDEAEIVNALVDYSLLNHLNIHLFDIVFSNKIPTPDIINEWIDTETSQTILLINLMLNTKISLPVTEYGCALLFSNRESARTQVFRPLQTALFDLADDFSYLLDAEQVEKKQIRQVWTTFLPSSALNILKTTIFDVESGLTLDPNKFYQIDLHLGKLDDSHVWLALALAADGISHGQEGQVIAAQSHDAIHIMQLSDKSNQVVEEEDTPFFYPIVYLLSTILCLISVIALLPANHIEYSEIFLITAVGAILFSFVTSISLYYKFVIYCDSFERRWVDELKKIIPEIHGGKTFK